MELAISVCLAFLISGISQVSKDLGGRAIERRIWALQPTLGKALLVGATWFTRPFLEQAGHGQVVRTAVFGVMSVVLQMAVLTVFIYGCILIAEYFFDSAVAKVVAAAVLMAVGALFVLPVVSLIMIPVTLLIAWPLDLLLPLKDKTAVANDVAWCRNCKHYRKAKEYEDIMTGLWRSESVPRSDKLPCAIPLEAADTWKRYYSFKPSQRALFPKDCSLFERRR